MASDRPRQDLESEKRIVERSENPKKMPLSFLPFPMQLRNVYIMEMVAKRSRIEMVDPPLADLSLGEIEVDEEHLQASVVLTVKMEFSYEPHPFDILFKIGGEFSYTSGYSVKQIHKFLEQGAMSVLLPFARETLYSICLRLQVTPVMLTMLQTATFPLDEIEKE